MPCIQPSSYSAPRLLTNAHAQTVWATVSRRLPDTEYARERIVTSDRDFLDLDWHGTPSSRVAIIAHGLEGNSRRTYIRGMAAALVRHGWQTVSLNFRGCSGEPNLQPRLYHSGITEDLETVVRHVRQTRPVAQVALIGFSLGGNVILKYVGERGARVDPAIIGAVAFSVPCDLGAAQDAMARPANEIYMRRFLVDLRQKLRIKSRQFPGLISLDGYDSIRSFREFDGRYTAPLHGFRDADDYYTRCSSIHFLKDINVPTLLVNAADDPFLSPECHPFQIARDHPQFHFECPSHGGHVGFVSRLPLGEYWSERRAAEFLNGCL